MFLIVTFSFYLSLNRLQDLDWRILLAMVYFRGYK